MDAIYDLYHQAASVPPLPPPVVQSIFPTSTVNFPDVQYQQTHTQQEAKPPRCLMLDLEKERFMRFWQQQLFDTLHMTDVKQHALPLARIKKIMKADPEVKMISTATPYILSKACELFILDMTLRSWLHTEEGNRRTLQRGDVQMAITHSGDMDFLLDLFLKVFNMEMEKDACSGSAGNGVMQCSNPTMQYPLVHVPTSFGQGLDLQSAVE